MIHILGASGFIGSQLYEHLSEKERGKAFNYLLRLEKEIEFAESVYTELSK